MNSGKLKRRTALAAAIAGLVYAAGAAAGNDFAGAASMRLGHSVVADAKTGEVAVRSRYIVVLKEEALALAPSMPRSGNSRRIDVQSSAAQSYVARLAAQQDVFVADASKLLGRAMTTTARFQHALNGLVTELTEDEAAALAAHPQVAIVEADVELPLDTDRGPTMIGAPGVWDGSGTPGNLATKGAGVVIGIIDSGINQASPSFAAVGGDGYQHVNPLGAGNYLGWCNPTNSNYVAGQNNCNDKVIGGWDFTDSQSNNTVVEARGIEDEGGHGTHTASTALGNVRAANFNGIARNISGVAPHANLVIYDACYLTPSGGSCPGSSTTNSINQAVADGIVDVLSYSIAGGASPWTQTQSVAFLGAQNAGIVIAASAGNSGPTPATVGHLEPWVVTVGGTMHDRVFGFNFSMTAPGTPPPANVQNITVRPGGAPIASATLAGPIIVSPNFANGATDGCAAYPVNFFRRTGDGGAQIPTIAVLHLDGTTSACASGARRTAALTAGAAGVLFVDDAPLSLGANQTSYSMLRSEWDRVAAHIATDPANATARIEVPLNAGPGTPDAVYNSTSRGPNPYSLLKPDLAAPGVEILAAYTRWVSAAPAPFGGAADVARNDIVNAISGTSMAAPHVAGSLALLRALNRSWTPAQLKSALMTTAKPELMEVDGVTPTTPFATGAGRIDVARASKAGLILDETGANYLAANPATGGNPSQLNIASFQNLDCVGTCTFPRKLTSTRRASVTWTASVAGPAAPTITVTPASFTVANFATANVTVSADATQLPQDVFTFGEVILTPSDASIPSARMPIALRPAKPEIDVSPMAVSATVETGQSVSRDVLVRNVGNPTVTWDIDAAGSTGTLAMQTQTYDGNWGNSSNFYVGQGAAGAGNYIAEDFISPDAATLRTMEVAGFITGTGSATLQATATQITFKVYSDDNGKPAGNPEAGAAGEVYSCTRTPAGANSAGLTFRSLDGASFFLNLETAAAATAPANCPAPPALAPNTRYWGVTYATVPGTSSARRWSYGRATTTNGLRPMVIAPNLTGASQVLQWTALDPIAGPPAAIASSALTVTTTVGCGAPWLSTTPSAGSLGVAGLATVAATANSTGLALGNYRGHVCVDSNGTDADEARTAVPFSLEVTAPANQAPAFANDSYTFGVAAAAANGAAVGTVAATDPNAADTLTYAITGGNTGNAFAIDAATGAITVAGAPLTPNAVFDLTVSATDGGGLSDTATVRVTVGAAANQAPAFSNDSYAFGVPVAAPNGAAVGTVAATDPNAADTLTYAITGGNTGNAFAIDAATGAITVAGAPLVANAVFDLTVTVTDGGGLSDTATARVTVGDATDRIFRDGFDAQ
jgi:hypothetical protein